MSGKIECAVRNAIAPGPWPAVCASRGSGGGNSSFSPRGMTTSPIHERAGGRIEVPPTPRSRTKRPGKPRPQRDPDSRWGYTAAAGFCQRGSSAIEAGLWTGGMGTHPPIGWGRRRRSGFVRSWSARHISRTDREGGGEWERRKNGGVVAREYSSVTRCYEDGCQTLGWRRESPMRCQVCYFVAARRRLRAHHLSQPPRPARASATDVN